MLTVSSCSFRKTQVIEYENESGSVLQKRADVLGIGTVKDFKPLGEKLKYISLPRYQYVEEDGVLIPYVRRVLPDAFVDLIIEPGKVEGAINQTPNSDASGLFVKFKALSWVEYRRLVKQYKLKGPEKRIVRKSRAVFLTIEKVPIYTSEHSPQPGKNNSGNDDVYDQHKDKSGSGGFHLDE